MAHSHIENHESGTSFNNFLAQHKGARDFAPIAGMDAVQGQGFQANELMRSLASKVERGGVHIA